MRHRFLSRSRLRQILWRLRRAELREALLRHFQQLWISCLEGGALQPEVGGQLGPYEQTSVLVALALRAALEELHSRPPRAWNRATP